MTNLFPKEALDKVEQDLNHKIDNYKTYTEKGNMVAMVDKWSFGLIRINKIRKAQENYEIRDLLLSVWARQYPELILYQKDDNTRGLAGYTTDNGKYYKQVKRVIVYNNKVYPFKQSSPRVLVDMFMDCYPYPDNIIEWGVNNSYNDFMELMNKTGMWECRGALFFCSEEYTKETGIEPYIGDYDKIVQEYIKYLQWKINNG